MVEGLGLDNAHARVLLDAHGLGVSGVARIPGPCPPVRVHDEDPAAGGDGEDGLRLSGQADCFLLFWLRVLAVLEGVDLSLPVHGQEQVVVQADAGEPGILACVENRGCVFLAVPGVDVLVGSECCLRSAAGCGLLVAEPVGSLGWSGNLFRRAVLRPCVDAAVAGQADKLVSCGLDADKLRFLPVGRADGQLGSGGGPVVRAQRPVRGFRPLCFQGGVLEDWGLEVERLAVKRPPVELEALTLRVLLQGSGESTGFYG